MKHVYRFIEVAVGDGRKLLAHGAHGALVNRNVLYPGAEDPMVVAKVMRGIIRPDWMVEKAMVLAKESMGGKNLFTNMFDHGGSQ